MPHIHTEEYLAFERLHERQREIDTQRRLSHRHESHLINIQPLLGSLGTFFIALGTRMQQVKQHGEHSV